MGNIITIEIKAIEKSTRDGSKKFLVFSAKTKDNGWKTIKFVMACENVPKVAGRYLITVYRENINKSTNDYGELYWVKNINTCIEKPVDDCSTDFE